MVATHLGSWFIVPLCFRVDLPIIPEVDLAFAISANAVQSDANFQKMKNVINEIVEMFGQERIHYSVIVFGSVPDVIIQFNDYFPTDVLLKTLRSVERAVGSALLPTLQKAQEIFKNYSRPGVRRVLVVITDSKSDSDENGLRERAFLLEQDQIKVIPVGLGGETDDTELETLTPRKKDVVTKPDNTPTKILVKVIMTKVIEGNLSIYFRCCRFTYPYHKYPYQQTSLSVCLSAFSCPSVCMSACLSVCLPFPVHLYICPPVCLSICLFLSVCMYVRLSVCLSVCLFLSVCLYVRLSVCLFVSLLIYLFLSSCLSIYLSVSYCLSICLAV